jgi:hypothetical protein
MQFAWLNPHLKREFFLNTPLRDRISVTARRSFAGHFQRPGLDADAAGP